MNSDFAIFILSYKRPAKIKTIDSLKKAGWNGGYYIIVADDDPTAEEYKRIHGDSVYVFSKKKAQKITDTYDNFKNTNSVVYARNMAFGIARELKIRYFMTLDDDYTSFVYKFDEDYFYKEKPIKNLDKIIKALLEFYQSIDAKTVAIAQNGDFIGGAQNQNAKEKKLRRKAMNTFVCDTENPFSYFARGNDDVTTYTVLGTRGQLFLTVPLVAIIQSQTQLVSGGLTEMYIDSGTYVKSFYTVIGHPAGVKVGSMGAHHRRLHHHISWNNTTPLILSEEIKKK
jgi:hypothetical protein